MSKRKNLTDAAKRRTNADLDSAMYEGTGLPDDFFASLDDVGSKGIQTVETTIRADGGVARIGNFSLSATGVEIAEGVSEDEWWAFWEVIAAFESSLQWIIGDALVYGDLKFGKTYEDVSAQIDRYSEDTLRQYAHVARTIPPLIRINMLSFAHHQVLAAMDLSDEKRREYLSQATAEGWSVTMLRQQVSGVLPPSKRPAWQKKLDAVEQTYTPGRWKKMAPKSRREAYDRLKNLLDQMENWGLD